MIVFMGRSKRLKSAQETQEESFKQLHPGPGVRSLEVNAFSLRVYGTWPFAHLILQVNARPSTIFQSPSNIKSTHLEFHYLSALLGDWIINVFQKLELLG